ncbi:hypothetical protein TNIN_230781 [Trichonephila inaurata madagascariensis]|uniref:Uncharacterized protein n=1 Tax=Trichonephila inaurata madagascariensis TaxID=2747483 RepID=A0A8X7BR89_9ARAC|nr:hypothetical protein TNIN_230781 [Trichonephila inaurata madagascariensis]
MNSFAQSPGGFSNSPASASTCSEAHLKSPQGSSCASCISLSQIPDPHPRSRDSGMLRKGRGRAHSCAQSAISEESVSVQWAIAREGLVFRNGRQRFVGSHYGLLTIEMQMILKSGWRALGSTPEFADCATGGRE